MTQLEDYTIEETVRVTAQEYDESLFGLRQHMGIAAWAGSGEPCDDFRLPDLRGVEEEALIAMALQGRPEINVAESQVARTRAAVCLARGERIPVFQVGPSYASTDYGSQIYGITLSTPVPVFNSGLADVRHREAEYQRSATARDQIRQKVIAQVRAAVILLGAARERAEAASRRLELALQVLAAIENPHDGEKPDPNRNFESRQKCHEARNGRLEAEWKMTEAYAELLAAVGVSPLLSSALPATPLR